MMQQQAAPFIDRSISTSCAALVSSLLSTRPISYHTEKQAKAAASMATPAARAALRRPNILVTGTPGTGKTTNAAAIAVRACRVSCFMDGWWCCVGAGGIAQGNRTSLTPGGYVLPPHLSNLHQSIAVPSIITTCSNPNPLIRAAGGDGPAAPERGRPGAWVQWVEGRWGRRDGMYPSGLITNR